MCDFFGRLGRAVAELDGVASVRIKHGGTRGVPNRYRNHPHMIVRLRTGEVVEYPLRGRPKDKSHGYFCSILHGIRRRIKGLVGVRCPVRDARNATPKAPCIQRRCQPKRRRTVRIRKELRSFAQVKLMPTRLDRDPWAALQNLFMTELPAASQPTASPSAFSTQGECDDDE